MYRNSEESERCHCSVSGSLTCSGLVDNIDRGKMVRVCLQQTQHEAPCPEMLPALVVATRKRIPVQSPGLSVVDQEFYIHFDELDRRLDRWISGCSVREVIEPDPKCGGSDPTKGSGEFAGVENDSARRAVSQRRFSGVLDEMSTIGRGFSKAEFEAMQRFEKIREEKTKVKNVQVACLGGYAMETWYFSPYALYATADAAQIASRLELGELSEKDKRNTQRITLNEDDSLVVVDHLFICEGCLKYFQLASVYEQHVASCEWRNPPGILIYNDGNTSAEGASIRNSVRRRGRRNRSSRRSVRVYEVDGMLSSLYCQNMCLLAKLFLDHKTLYFDVAPFLFYVVCEVVYDDDDEQPEVADPVKVEPGSGTDDGMVYTLHEKRGEKEMVGVVVLDDDDSSETKVKVEDVDSVVDVEMELEKQRMKDPSSGRSGSPRCEFVGFFSKEKPVCNSEFNLACIMTLPPFQSKGYGTFMIALSYELTRREGKTGTPERPLSDLGLVSYRSYWTRTLLAHLKRRRNACDVTIAELAKATAIREADIVSTLKMAGLLTHWRGDYVVKCAAKLVDDAIRQFDEQQNKRISSSKSGGTGSSPSRVSHAMASADRNRVEFKRDLLVWSQPQRKPAEKQAEVVERTPSIRKRKSGSSRTPTPASRRRVMVQEPSTIDDSAAQKKRGSRTNSPSDAPPVDQLAPCDLSKPTKDTEAIKIHVSLKQQSAKAARRASVTAPAPPFTSNVAGKANGKTEDDPVMIISDAPSAPGSASKSRTDR